jgi:Holliday junction resolvase RusA-like endonuclease
VIELELPFPPSVNHYYRRVGFRTLISREGRAFREKVCAILSARRIKPLPGPLSVRMELFPPDLRRRDLDNYLKGTLDAVEHAGAYHDDSQIKELQVWMRGPIPGGKVLLRITRTNEQPETRRERG